MSKPGPKGIPPSQKREIVLRVIRGEVMVRDAARELGVSENSIHNWKNSFLEGGLKGLTHGSASETRRVKELEKEIQRRDQVIGELTIANRILKKRSDS